jgi:hypothetical protein
VLTGAYNLAAYQEVVVDTAGVGCRAGRRRRPYQRHPARCGNTFGGTSFFAFANDTMAGSNLTPSLKDRGLRTPDSLKQILDVNPGFGGPIQARPHLVPRRDPLFARVELHADLLQQERGQPECVDLRARSRARSRVERKHGHQPHRRVTCR